MNKTWILVVVMMAAGVADAKGRYMVTFKSKQGFQAMQNYFVHTQRSGRIQKSLNGLNAIVLKSGSAATAASLKNHPEVAAIESEFFIPSPKPINGFKPAIVANTMRVRPEFFNLENTTNDSIPIFTEGPKTPWGILAIKAGGAWADSAAGANARVLVLDTGIDPEHQDLKANFEQGKNFFETEEGKVDATDFIDKEGHGTHVSGTIAASYNAATGFTGVAPKAKILMGRVCGKEGCSNIAISEGINWGIEQHVDVISMSLGGPFGSPSHEIAVKNAEAAGVMVVAASGNDGTAQISFPAAYADVFAVGAIDISLKKTSFSQWGPELDIVAPGSAVISAVPRGSGRDSVVGISYPGIKREIKSAAFSGTKLVTKAVMKKLVVSGLGKPEDFAAAKVKGKFALIARGEIRFSEKVANAMAAGAVGAVIYNNVPGLMQGALTEDGTELDFPVVMIEQKDGLELVEVIAKGITAKAKIVTSASDYAMFDGTSMATPHVAGVIALMRSANKKLTPAQMRSILASTATPLGPNSENEYGAGNVQADKAVAAALAL